MVHFSSEFQVIVGSPGSRSLKATMWYASEESLSHFASPSSWPNCSTVMDSDQKLWAQTKPFSLKPFSGCLIRATGKEAQTGPSTPPEIQNRKPGTRRAWCFGFGSGLVVLFVFDLLSLKLWNWFDHNYYSLAIYAVSLFVCLFVLAERSSVTTPSLSGCIRVLLEATLLQATILQQSHLGSGLGCSTCCSIWEDGWSK